mgnify:FL=1
MAEERINIWNEAAVPGLVLGFVSIAYMVVTMLTSKFAGTGATAVLIGILDFVLWAVKFAACILLLRHFLLAFSKRNPSADNRKVFHFGMATALFSALLYSGFYLVYVLYIDPEMLSSAMETALASYSGMMDSGTLAAMQDILPDMPAIGFFSNLIWCWLFGTVLSSIFSRNIPAPVQDDPFKDNQ